MKFRIVDEDRRINSHAKKPRMNLFHEFAPRIESTFLLFFFFSVFTFSSRCIFHGIAVNTVELVFRRQSVAIERASSQLIDLLRRPALSRSYLHTQPTYCLHCTQKRHDLAEDGARKRSGGYSRDFYFEKSDQVKKLSFRVNFSFLDPIPRFTIVKLRPDGENLIHANYISINLSSASFNPSK